jgi:diguanylate cyclase (GGDEF)-like protein
MTLLAILGSAVIGFLAGVAAITLWHHYRREPLGPISLPSNVEHLLDLVNRLHETGLACLVGPGDSPLVVTGTAPKATVDRAVAVAKLAIEDGRQRVMPVDDEHKGSLVALGDFSLGAAVLVKAEEPSEAVVAEIVRDLRRLLAEVHLESRRSSSLPPGAWGRRQALPSGLDTLPAVSSGICERARAITGRATAVVVRDRTTETATVIAVSRGADRRLIGESVTSDSAVGRACMGDMPVVARSGEDIFGRLPSDRRRRHDQGTAYPLKDGRESCGALVVFGRSEGLDPEVREQVAWLATDMGARLGAAAAVQSAETRALTDSLTGLPNRKAFEQAMAMVPDAACSLLCVDIDHFKKLNDEYGHAAGDAALKHLAKVFRSALREADVPARIGGEEFALWLPGASLKVAVEIAERVRRAATETRWEWAGRVINLTCSIGIASRPETTSEVANLVAAADAAMYRAKRAGRDRIEVASATH